MSDPTWQQTIDDLRTQLTKLEEQLKTPQAVKLTDATFDIDRELFSKVQARAVTLLGNISISKQRNEPPQTAISVAALLQQTKAELARDVVKMLMEQPVGDTRDRLIELTGIVNKAEVKAAELSALLNPKP